MTEANHYDEITAQKLLYITGSDSGRCPPREEGAVGGGYVGDYEEPRPRGKLTADGRYVVGAPEDANRRSRFAGVEESALKDHHYDNTTGENHYESMENLRLAMEQNEQNEQQEGRYVTK